MSPQVRRELRRCRKILTDAAVSGYTDQMQPSADLLDALTTLATHDGKTAGISGDRHRRAAVKKRVRAAEGADGSASAGQTGQLFGRSAATAIPIGADQQRSATAPIARWR